MSAEQLALGCDPAWLNEDDYDALCALGSALLHDPLRHRDLRGQGLTSMEIHTMTDVPLVGSYL
ncbi:hypothetical protein [Streptomyces sp. YKOK-I1]